MTPHGVGEILERFDTDAYSIGYTNNTVNSLLTEFPQTLLQYHGDLHSENVLLKLGPDKQIQRIVVADFKGESLSQRYMSDFEKTLSDLRMNERRAVQFYRYRQQMNEHRIAEGMEPLVIEKPKTDF